MYVRFATFWWKKIHGQKRERTSWTQLPDIELTKNVPFERKILLPYFEWSDTKYDLVS